MSGAHSMYGGEERCIQDLVGKSEEKRPPGPSGSGMGGHELD